MRASFQDLLAIVAMFGCVASAGFAADPPDRSMRVIQTTDIRVGDTLSPDLPSNGEVRLLVLVDETGKLVDLLLAGSTHRAFTKAAVEALQEWRIEPAYRGGQPIGTRTILRLFFDTRGRVVSISGADALPMMLETAFGPTFHRRVAKPQELDAPVQAIEVVQPRFPLRLLGQLPEPATVVIDFYIDETGRPRMPVVVRSAHPLLSETAIIAIDAWRFAPPTRDGQPVVVHALQEFVFSEPSSDGAAAAIEREPLTDPSQ